MTSKFQTFFYSKKYLHKKFSFCCLFIQLHKQHYCNFVQKNFLLNRYKSNQFNVVLIQYNFCEIRFC